MIILSSFSSTPRPQLSIFLCQLKSCPCSCLPSTCIPWLNVNQKQESLKFKNVIPKVENFHTCGHGPILQTSRNRLNGCIVPSQKNFGKGTRPNTGIGSHRSLSIGHRFFPIPLIVGPDIIGTEWTGIGNGSQLLFFIGPINKGHQK